MVDIATVKSISNPADINRLLLDAVALERTIDGDLDKVLASSSEISAILASLKSETAESLELAKNEAVRLCQSTADTAQLADKVSSKIRTLDAAQSRVRSTLARIEVVVDRSRAIEGVEIAFQKDNLEAAAGCIARFFEIDDEDANQSPTSIPSTLADPESNQREVMNEWKTKVQASVRARTAEAVAAKDHAAVAGFARLYAPLGLPNEGVDVLTNYLRGLLSERAQIDYNALVDGFAADTGAKVDYVDALTNVFRDVAAAIDEHLELFRDAFGPELALNAVYSLHAECDIRCTRILQRFVDHRSLARVAGQISMRRKDDSSAAAAPIEPRRVESFLSEILALCTRGEEYTQYLLVRLADAAAPSPLAPAKETALRSGRLNTALRELLSYYITLEEYYIEESVAKAVRIDEIVPGALTSSMVDDTFFVALSAGRRALATGRAPSAVSILNQINTVLSTVYMSALSQKLQGMAGRLAAAAPSHPSSTSLLQSTTSLYDTYTTASHENVSKYAVSFNNVDISAGYVEKLRQQLEDMANQIFAAPHDRDRIKLVLADLNKTASDYKKLSFQGSEQLSNALAAHLRPVMDEFVEISYVESDIGNNSNPTASWAQALILTFATHFGWLQSLLTPSLYESIVHSAVDKVVARMEAAVAQKRFTQLGGLQLEREVRSLVVGFSEITTRSVRDKFARLQQTATVLGLETADEAAELMNGETVGWRLSSLDVRQALSQRVEFSPSAVAAVKLH